MHFSTLLTSLSALAATSVAIPAPAPIAEALPVPAAMADPPEIPYMTDGPFAGSLPKNFAKIWVYSNLKCDTNDGPSYNINVLPGQDRCIPYQNVGSMIAWYKSSIGKCKVTVHSGSDCRGDQWQPWNKQCSRGLFASVKVSCPNL